MCPPTIYLSTCTHSVCHCRKQYRVHVQYYGTSRLDGRRWRTFLEILWVNVCVGDRPQTTTAYSTTTELLKFGNDANYWSFICCQYCKFPAWMSAHHQCLPQPQQSALIILHIFPFINRSNAVLCDAWRWWKRWISGGLHSEAAVATHYTITQCINNII